MLDNEELDARWRDGLHVLAAHIAETVPTGAAERVDQHVQDRARTRVVRYSVTGVLALAAIIGLIVVLFGRPWQDDARTAPAKACKPVTSTVSVHALASLKFDASTYYADAGCVQIVYEGAAGHTLAFDAPGPSSPILGSAPGGGPSTGTFAWNLRPGTYTFSCTVPGHRAAGMQATLVVR